MNTTFAIVGFTSLGVCLGWGPTVHPAATALRELNNVTVKNASLEISYQKGAPVAGKALDCKATFKIVNASHYLVEVPVVVQVVKYTNGKPVIHANSAALVKRSKDGFFRFDEKVPAPNLTPGKYEAQVICKSDEVIAVPLELKAAEK